MGESEKNYLRLVNLYLSKLDLWPFLNNECITEFIPFVFHYKYG